MNIHNIRSAPLRRIALVFTVVAILVVLGPLHLVNKALAWVEDEFDVDLRVAWRGPKKQVSGCTCPPGTSCYERCGE